MVVSEQRFASVEVAAHALADELAAVMREAINKRGQAILAVSGGHTPRYVFKRLRQMDLDWAQVTLTLTDERWVPPTHPDSNERLVHSCLLQGAAQAATFIPLYGGENSPEAGEAGCEERLKDLTLPFDAVYLGMGADGHFASLFPGDSAIDVTCRRCVAVPATKKRLPRISLTASSLLDARKVYLLFSGADKHAKYDEAKKAGNYKEIPLRLVLVQEYTSIYVLSAP